MEQNFKKRYGLITAICMVVGIVIGSGIFYKTEKILEITRINATLGVVGWIIGGLIMVACACTFGILAQKYQKINGVVDYSEEMCGKKYGFFMSWFINLIYFPAMTGVLAVVSSMYLLEVIMPDAATAWIYNVALLLLILSYVMNYLSPKIAGYFQVSATVIKMIPIVLLGVVGLIVGLTNGNLSANMTNTTLVNGAKSIFDVVCATAFAYEGWIIATTINAELKNPKKDLPKALFIGSIIVICLYVAYYLGVLGGARNMQIINEGSSAAFINIFGNVAGKILKIFVAISCMGTLNGLTIGCTRGIYSMAVRKQGVMCENIAKLDEKTNMPSFGCIVSFVICFVWLLYFMFANISSMLPKWMSFDSSELPIITIYAMYIPIFINMMRKEKDLSTFNRFVLPGLAIAGSVFMVIAAIVAHKTSVITYLILFAIVMAIGIGIEWYKKGDNGRNGYVSIFDEEDDEEIEFENEDDEDLEEENLEESQEEIEESEIEEENSKEIKALEEELEKEDIEESQEEIEEKQEELIEETVENAEEDEEKKD